MNEERRPVALAWLTPMVVAVSAFVLPIIAFALLWQIRVTLNGVHLAAKVGRVSVPEDYQIQALRFVAFGAAVALIALIAAVNAVELAAAARATLVATSAVLLVHAAFLGPEAWMHDMAKPYPSYIGFVIAEGVLFAIAAIAQLYASIYRGLYGAGRGVPMIGVVSRS
ncbi:hypothetical protein [Tsukamurella sp. PLM1]|uniref:hypothetical protein n=1 Tax=Tsukamurella sp. PLM1 TaxID=2929795 RepID=UPI00205FCF7B|nr:hypothetical protein [Tsukamurella sp. PLM1]BDH56340.1 hypothetical protein MTP03_12790 [Tsukamurella sp. PLM1]